MARAALAALCLSCGFAGAAPSITSQPAAVSVVAGKNAALRVSASGGTLTYQWFQGTAGDTTAPVTGATGPLLVSNVLRATTTFWVRVTDGTGSTDSVAATATVSQPIPARLMAAGSNPYGQLGDGTTTTRTVPFQVATDVVATATNWSSSLFIKADGSLWAMGLNTNGQLGDGTRINRLTPKQVATGIVQVAAGVDHSHFLKADGTLWAVGYNEVGELGDGTTTNRLTPVQIATGVNQVAAGDSQSFYIKNDGSLWAHGANGHGKLGTGNTSSRSTPIQVASGVSQVATGYDHTLFVKADGTLWTVGANESGQLGDGTITDHITPAQVATDVISCSAGMSFSLFLKSDGSLWGMGSNSYGELGGGSFLLTRYVPFMIASSVNSMAAGYYHSIFVKDDRSLWGTGSNGNGQLADGTTISRSTPSQSSTAVVGISAGWAHSLFLDLRPGIAAQPVDVGIPSGGTTSLSITTSSSVPVSYQWFKGNSGNTSQPVSGATSQTLTTQPAATNTSYWVRISSSYGTVSSRTVLVEVVSVPQITSLSPAQSLPRESSATLSATVTGGMLSFQWYEGPAGDISKPIPSATDPQLLTFPIRGNTLFWLRASNAAGTADSPAVVVTTASPQPSRLLATGENDGGQFGDGSIVNRSLPTLVTGSVASFDAGYGHSLFVKTDGSLWAAGRNNYGQLGDGTKVIRATPVQVVTGAASASAGYFHSLFLKTDGTLWAMGYNASGRLGDGTFEDRTSPVQIAQNVISASAGYDHSLFVKSDGSLWAMGNNSSGQLGDGTTTTQSIPVQVAQNVVCTSAGNAYSLFVKSDGSLWAMGSNSSGQLGNGTTSSASIRTPVQVASGVCRAEAAVLHSLFIRTNGSLWAMGSNNSGRLGDGTTSNRYEPVQIASNVSMAAAGYSYSLFVKSDGSLWGMGSNSDGQLGDGTTTSRTSPVQVALNVSAVSAGDTHTLIGDRVPFIATPPADTGVPAGGSTLLAVSASGPGTLTYQWYAGASGSTVSPVSGATSSIYQTPPATGNTTYWVRVSNSAGSADSRSALVEVVTQPVIGSTTVPATVSGDYAALGVSTSGGAMFYQWFEGESGDTSHPVGGATGPLFLTPPLNGAVKYWVRATNAAGSADSATLSPNVAPRQAANLFATGSTQYGALGTGAMILKTTPSPITGGVSQVIACDGQPLILKPDASLWTLSSTGQLTALDSDVAFASANSGSKTWVKTNGTLWIKSQYLNPVTPGQVATGVSKAWTVGQVLYILKTNNSLVSRSLSSATETAIDTGVVNGSGGYANFLYLKSDGSLWGMGNNSYGQLGFNVSGISIRIASDVTKFSSGTYTNYFVRTDGTLWGLGNNELGQLGTTTPLQFSYPVALSANVSDVSANSRSVVFIKTDGSLWGMGANFFGQLGDGTLVNRPSPIPIAGQVSQASSGAYHSLFVTSGGILWGMGFSTTGQLGDPSVASEANPAFVTGGVVETAAGNSHTLLLKPDGSLWASGSNDKGELGVGNDKPSSIPLFVTGGVAKIATGANHSLFIKHDGSLWAMGSNNLGQLGDGSVTDRMVPVRIAEDVSSIAAGDEHSVFIKTDGSLWAMGYNAYGQLGDGTANLRSTPVPIASGVAAVSAGVRFSSYLTNDGRLWGMGYNFYGQIGDGTSSDRYSPLAVSTGVVRLACGSSHRLFIKADGTLWASGENTYGQLGDSTTTTRYSSVQIAAGATSCTAGSFQSKFIKADGTLWAMGYNLFRQLGDGTTTNRSSPVQVAANVSAASCGYLHSAWLTSNSGSASLAVAVQPVSVQIPSGGSAQLSVTAVGTGTISYQWYSGRSGDTSQPVSGATHSVLPLSPATVVSDYWVRITSGAHTADSRTARISPVDPPSVLTELAVATASPAGNVRLTVAGSANTTSYQWFQGTSGDESHPITGGKTASVLTLPILTTTPFWVKLSNLAGSVNSGTLLVSKPAISGREPAAVGSSYPAASVFPQTARSSAMAVTGKGHGLFVKTSGTLWGIGSNASGPLGTGNESNASIPIQITDQVAAAAAGGSHSLFIKSDGTLWAMGSNTYGQLGDGTRTTRLSPVFIARDVAFVTAGDSHSLFIKTDGTLWGMGNDGGRLGTGSGAPPSVTSPVMVASSVAFAAAGVTHSVFIKTDGSLWGMGINTYSQLGLGLPITQPTPVKIMDGAACAAAGSSHTLVIKADGSLWSCGSNSGGQLGFGNVDASWGGFSPSSSAGSVPTLAGGNAVMAAGGTSHSLWLVADNSLWGSGSSFGNYAYPGKRLAYCGSVSAAGGNSLALLANTSAEPPTITAHPASLVVPSGSPATFTVGATGAPTLQYQWYSGQTGSTSQPISGATSSSYTVPQVSQTTNLWVKVSNASAWSESITATAVNGTATQAYQDWAAALGLQGLNLLPTADTDRDGRNNLLEYLTGSVPSISDVAGAFTTLPDAANNLTDFQVTLRGDPGLRLSCMLTSDFVSWQTAPLSYDNGVWTSGDPLVQVVSATPTGGGMWNLTLRYGGSPQRLFMKISAEMPPDN